MTCPPPLAALCACMCAMSMCIHVHCVYVHACATMDALLSTPFAAPLVAPLAAPLTAPIANQSRARPRSVASSSEIGRELVRDRSRARPRSVASSSEIGLPGGRESGCSNEGESLDAATRERAEPEQRTAASAVPRGGGGRVGGRGGSECQRWNAVPTKVDSQSKYAREAMAARARARGRGCKRSHTSHPYTTEPETAQTVWARASMPSKPCGLSRCQ